MSKLTQLITSKKFWKELIIMTLGMAIASAGVYYFMVPGKLVLGSISGLSIVLSKLLSNLTGIEIKVSLMVTVINAILLLMAWLLIGKEFGAKTVYTAMILGPLMEFWAKVLPYEKLMEAGSASVMGDFWFDLLCFVLIVSASQTILFSINASTGGLDILAKIINKYLHFDIGKSVSIAGALICCTAFSINPFRMVIVGLIGTWINGLFLDFFTANINRRKRVCIITKEHDRVREFIINKMSRGCTLYEATGGYSLEKSIEIQTLLTQDEFAHLMAFLKKYEINAFITASNISEVYGIWNKKVKE